MKRKKVKVTFGEDTSQAARNPLDRMAMKVIFQATQDARLGDPEAIYWLKSDDCAGWLRVLGFDENAARRWVEKNITAPEQLIMPGAFQYAGVW